MDDTGGRSGIIFIGPSKYSQGGISVVIENYRKTGFWQEFGCTAFPSTADFRSIFVRIPYEFWRLCLFAWTMRFSGRPWAVSIHTGLGGSIYRKLAYLALARVWRVPAVLHIHTGAFAETYNHGSGLRRRAIRLADRLSDQIVCLSEETRSGLLNVFTQTGISVLGNPVDIDSFKHNEILEGERRPRILFLGWIIREKGVYDLVDAIPSVVEKFPNILFTFAGSKEVEKLRDLVASRGLAKFAEVLGWVEGQDKIDLIKSSRILTLPSYSEGVPNVILEAMASKLPIVTTPVGGIPSVLKHDQTAIFVEPANIQSIAQGLISLLEDNEKCISLANAAYNQVLELYSIQAVSRGLTQIYGRYSPTAQPQYRLRK